jgi:MFS family permease
VLLFGLVVLTAGLGLFATGVQAGTAYFPGLFFGYALIGLGAGTAFMTLVTLALADVPARDAGIASGLVNVSVQISAALGLAVLGTIAASHSAGLAAQGETATQALAGGYQLAFVVAAGCVAAALIAALLWIREPQAPEPEVVVETDGALAVAGPSRQPAVAGHARAGSARSRLPGRDRAPARRG